MPALSIRPYAPEDRAAVRRIARDTADGGDPMGGIDPEFLADLLTSYYTDAEPASAWVAALDGRPVGYLTGCLDTRRYARAVGRLSAAALWRAAGRGALLRAGTWRWLAAGVGTGLLAGNYRKKYMDDFPAHFHINLLPEARGASAGRGLMDAFLGAARRAGVPGVHLAAWADNGRALKFFARFGFARAGTTPMLFPSEKGLRRREAAVLTLKLAP